jgi:hypothetical protein
MKKLIKHKPRKGGARPGAGHPFLEDGKESKLVQLRATPADMTSIMEYMSSTERAEACIEWMARREAMVAASGWATPQQSVD